jgi:hypothetical protein
MSNNAESKKLNGNEYYKCPLPHLHPRQEQAYFKSFDSHFSTFSSRDDHLAVLQLHEELNWKTRCSESEKRNLNEADLQRISQKTWMEAIKKQAGKAVQIVIRK